MRLPIRILTTIPSSPFNPVHSKTFQPPSSSFSSATPLSSYLAQRQLSRHVLGVLAGDVEEAVVEGVDEPHPIIIIIREGMNEAPPSKHLPCPCRRHELDKEVLGLWWVGVGAGVGTCTEGREEGGDRGREVDLPWP